VHLSLNQATTTVRKEFGTRAREILQDRADLMRKRVADFSYALPISKIELGSNVRLPGDYAAGHALGVTYELTTCPKRQVYVLTHHARLPCINISGRHRRAC
jgi:5-methylcytosine-specific restriction protein A